MWPFHLRRQCDKQRRLQVHKQSRGPWTKLGPAGLVEQGEAGEWQTGQNNGPATRVSNPKRLKDIQPALVALIVKQASTEFEVLSMRSQVGPSDQQTSGLGQARPISATKMKGGRALLGRHVMRQAAVWACGVDVEHSGATGHCRVSLHHFGTNGCCMGIALLPPTLTPSAIVEGTASTSFGLVAVPTAGRAAASHSRDRQLPATPVGTRRAGCHPP